MTYGVEPLDAASAADRLRARPAGNSRRGPALHRRALRAGRLRRRRSLSRHRLDPQLDRRTEPLSNVSRPLRGLRGRNPASARCRRAAAHIRSLSRPTRSTVSSSCSDAVRRSRPRVGRCAESAPAPAGGAPRPHAAVSNYQKGSRRSSTACAGSRSSYLVKGRSNLSDASLAFNPQLPYSFCPDVAALLDGSGR